jgi:hypothetical protein
MVGVLHRRHDMVNPIVSEFLEEEKNFFVSCANVFRKFDGVGSKFSIISKKNPKPEVTYDPCRYIRGGEIIKSKPYDDEIINKVRAKTVVSGNSGTNMNVHGVHGISDGINRISMTQFNNNPEFSQGNQGGIHRQATSVPFNHQNPLNFTFNPVNNNINQGGSDNMGGQGSNFQNQQFSGGYNNQQGGFDTQNKGMNDFYNFNNNFSGSNNHNNMGNQGQRNSLNDINQNYTDINYGGHNNMSNNNMGGFNFNTGSGGGNSFSSPNNTNPSSGNNTYSSPSNPPMKSNNPKPDDVFKDLF